MASKGFARGCFGDLVGLVQGALQQQGFYTGAVDGDFGGGTERAVRAFQASANLRQSGRVEPVTWQRATGLDWPDLFERCLQLTARLEGHGYQIIVGDFDGAGLTWGIIGFTLRSGGIQALLREALLRDPDLVRAAFGSVADELAERMATDDWDQLKAWADSISVGSKGIGVAQPWRDGFRQLGAAPFMKQLQRDRARRQYFEPAQATARALQLGGDLGSALAFDIHVQNGGVKPADRRTLEARMVKASDRGAAARRVALAGLVAASANAKWRADVAARKHAIATGFGEVHGLRLDLSAWGMDLADPP